MGVGKNDVVTTAAAVTAGLGGAFVAGPLGAAAAGVAAAAATRHALSSDKTPSDDGRAEQALER